MEKVELLAPAGNTFKFKTAMHFGADAVYLSGKKFGLRAFATNFTTAEMADTVSEAHSLGKKVYVAANIYAKDADFKLLPQFIAELAEINVDGVIVSDPGIVYLIKKIAPSLNIHLSTQANTTNSYAVRFWAEQGVSRIILARECALDEVAAICGEADKCGVEIECFVHGAMCVSMSGRCLLSDYFTARKGNRGECVQACRWEWEIREKQHPNKPLLVSEDERGTYFLNSKDLNMLSHLDKLIGAGVKSLKIEGRMKSEYYLATAVNAYRRAIDAFYGARDALENAKADRAESVADRVALREYNKTLEVLQGELMKAGHRDYTTGFYLFPGGDRQFYEHSRAIQEGEFIAFVLDWQNGVAKVEMRNRFKDGDRLEIISNGRSFGKYFIVSEMTDLDGNPVSDAKLVQQTIILPCPFPLESGDFLRKSVT